MAKIRITSAQQLYVAFYGRPADLEGRNFWDSVVQSDDDSDDDDGSDDIDYGAIVQAFGESEEARGRFGNASPAQAVRTLFNSILNREVDAQGLEFYVNELQSGRITLPKLAIAIVEGIEEDSDDARTFFNKVNAADLFSNALNTPDRSKAYNFTQNPDALAVALTFISQINFDSATIPALERIIELLEKLVSDDKLDDDDDIDDGFDDGFDDDGGLDDRPLFGTDGNDVLVGGDGEDDIIGGLGADVLTGGADDDDFIYQRLRDSLITGFDQITDFDIDDDDLEVPDFIDDSDVRNFGSVLSLDQAGVAAVLTEANFRANSVATFTFEQRTFVAINDGSAGFQGENDAVIEITGFSGNLANLSVS